MLDTILRIIALTRKELLAVLKDRRARMSLLIPPIVQGLIFGYAATYDLNHVPYAVLDQDRTSASRELLAGLDGSGVFERVADLHSSQDIRTYIDQRRALLVIQIEQNFERKLQLGQATDVQVIADGRNSNTAATASSYITAVVGQFNDNWRRDHGAPGRTRLRRITGPDQCRHDAERADSDPCDRRRDLLAHAARLRRGAHRDPRHFRRR